MTPGDELLDQTRRYAPATLRAVQLSEHSQAEQWHTAADALFPRPHPPETSSSACSRC